MTINYTYMQAISAGFPGVNCSMSGSNNIYENIVWESGNQLPLKTDLDIWIINQIKLDMKSLIQTERDRRKLSGGYAVDSYWYHSDDTSRIQQLALVMLGTNLPSGIMWKTRSGAFVEMTQTLAGQIFNAAVTSDQTLFTVSEQKTAAMLASQDPANYDYLSGWPLSYGE